jgi:hypothetical protein
MLRDCGASAAVVLVNQLRTWEGAQERGDSLGFGHADWCAFGITCERSVFCPRFIGEQTGKIVVVVWRRKRPGRLVEHLFGGVQDVAVRVELAEFDRIFRGNRDSRPHRFVKERVSVNGFAATGEGAQLFVDYRARVTRVQTFILFCRLRASRVFRGTWWRRCPSMIGGTDPRRSRLVDRRTSRDR